MFTFHYDKKWWQNTVLFCLRIPISDVSGCGEPFKIQIVKNVSGLSNKTVWNSLNHLFNKETQKLVIFLRSDSKTRNSLHGANKNDEKRVLNIGQVIKNRLEKLPYEKDKKEQALRKEARERKCQRLESCYYNCMRLRSGVNICRSSCQNAFDTKNECGSAKPKPSDSCKNQQKGRTMPPKWLLRLMSNVLTKKNLFLNSRRSKFFGGETSDSSEELSINSK